MVQIERLVEDDECRLRRSGKLGGEPVPLLVLGGQPAAEYLGVEAEETPRLPFVRPTVGAPSPAPGGSALFGEWRAIPVCGQAGPVGVVTDVVIARYSERRDGKLVEKLVCVLTVVGIVGVVEDEVAAVHDEVGWIALQLA
jgi:hypothetical protein